MRGWRNRTEVSRVRCCGVPEAVAPRRGKLPLTSAVQASGMHSHFTNRRHALGQSAVVNTAAGYVFSTTVLQARNNCRYFGVKARGHSLSWPAAPGVLLRKDCAAGSCRKCLAGDWGKEDSWKKQLKHSDPQILWILRVHLLIRA